MSSLWREFLNYAEFLRESGNLYLDVEGAGKLAGAKTGIGLLKPAVESQNSKVAPRAATRPVRATSNVYIAPTRDLPGPELIQTPPMEVLTEQERLARLEQAARQVAGCTRCKELCKTRTNTVYGSGSVMAKIVFMGEAPGETEDKTGLPFVGLAGQLLTKMIEAIGFKRDEVYICNTLKCRPPGNRDPLPEEKANCKEYLIQQLDWIRPQMIVGLGAHAATYLTGQEISVGKLRRKWHQYRGIPVLVTYHPAFLLRSPGFKPQAWEDMLMLHARYLQENPGEVRQIWQKGK